MGQPAARVTDMHTCPMVTPGTPPIPHVGGPILPACSPNVLTGGLPQARVTDMAYCVGPPDVILKGAMTVLVNGLPAARIGDQTVHGGVIVTGMPTVLIGDAGAGSAGGLGAAGAMPAMPSFAKSFEAMTGGMTMEESMALYKAATGKTIDRATIYGLFTDPAYAEKTLTNDVDLHRHYRDILNTNVPATEAEAKKRGFKKLPFYKALFHAPWKNSKYVSPDGHLEGVYDSSGRLDTSTDYKGTFNFFGPDDASGHWSADVKPYDKWGN